MRKRKFDCPSDNLRSHLELIGSNFLDGYHEAISSKFLSSKTDFRFTKVDSMYQGFAFEGAAMGFMLNDLFGLRKKGRIHKFIELHPEHDYMLHVGAGWAFARSPFANIEKSLDQFDPLLKWLVIDGYGFHQAYFSTNKYVHSRSIPKELKSEFALRAFYQGIGRAMWFVFGGQPKLISENINRFNIQYISDLWSGIGLASSYAGGVSREVLQTLKDFSGSHYGQVAQGCTFACKARLKANTMVPHTELAAEVLIGCSASEAAKITDDCLNKLKSQSSDESYFLWRKEIKEIFTKTLELC